LEAASVAIGLTSVVSEVGVVWSMIRELLKA
jgi:hypothetical protein